MSSPLERLAWPLAASLALHLVIGGVFSPGTLPFRQAKSISLTVTLASNRQAEAGEIARAAPSEQPTAAAVPAVAAKQSTDGQVTEKARFLVEPDLSELEDIAVPLSGTLTLRLHVSSLGTVDRVELLKNDPIPRELLDGVINKLRLTRLTPARAGSQPTASTLDLVIHYESAPTPLPREP